MPFHALLTVWGARFVGHYTALRLWKEALLGVLVLGSALLLARDRMLRHRIVRDPITQVIVIYGAVLLLWGVVAHASHQVSAKALGYGWVSDGRYLVFFLAAWAIASRVNWLRTRWARLVFWPLAVVVAFGLLQYFVLPYNFLTHFGYGGTTIFPYEDINDNVHLIRIMSTLRGANPLGAYLVATIILLAAWLLQVWRERVLAGASRRYVVGGLVLAAGSLLALILTFSRGAWIGLVAAAGCLVWLSIQSRVLRWRIAVGVAAASLVLAGIAVTFRNNSVLQNVLFHTQAHSAIATNSDQGHASALQSGLHDITHEPLGRGPGTAGPASIYNTGHPSRIAENYFIQIAQETGWVGLALFVAINGLVAYQLMRRRRIALALGLVAGLAGLTVVNLFSHAWADDTLAYLWWGLAGIAYAVPVGTDIDAPTVKH